MTHNAAHEDQFLNGVAECLTCGWKWAALWPLAADDLECKKCGSTDTVREESVHPLVFECSPIMACKHKWNNDGCNPTRCAKCGKSFLAYIHTEMP